MKVGKHESRNQNTVEIIFFKCSDLGRTIHNDLAVNSLSGRNIVW